MCVAFKTNCASSLCFTSIIIAFTQIWLHPKAFYSYIKLFSRHSLFYFIQTKVSSVGIWTQFWYIIYRPWLSSSCQFLCLWKENHFLSFFRPTFRGWTDSTLLTMKWAKCLWGEECDQMAPLPLLEVIGWASPSPQWVFLEAPLRAWGWVCPLGLIWPCHLMIFEGTLQYRNQRAHINIIIRPTLPGEPFLIT